MLLTDYLERNAKEHGQKTALVFKDVELSWSELWDKTLAAGSYLADKAASDKQEVIGLMLTNSDEFVIAYLGILQAGHIALPLDPNFKRIEQDVILGQIPPKFVISNEANQHRIDHSDFEVILAKDLLKGVQKKYQPIRQPAEKQIASLIFTSGTTGKPKAVPLTHANHIWNIKVCSEVWQWNFDDSLLISLPLSHVYGLAMSFAGVVYHGNTLYLQEWFDAPESLEYLASGKVSLFMHVAQFYAKLLEVPAAEKYDLSKVRLCISGGAPMAPTVWGEFKKRWGHEILEVYGSSETGRIASNLLDERIPGSPGHPLRGVEVKIGSDGEVLVRSEGQFPGYWKNPSATKAGFTNNGFWRTGDIGELTDGRLVLKGRKLERIRKKGYTISPRDVEWAMRQNPKIKDIHVLGHHVLGSQDDELVYFLVTDLSEAEIHVYCKENLLFAWRPDKIVMLEALPRTSTGKVSITKLKELAVG